VSNDFLGASSQLNCFLDRFDRRAVRPCPAEQANTGKSWVGASGWIQGRLAIQSFAMRVQNRSLKDAATLLDNPPGWKVVLAANYQDASMTERPRLVPGGCQHLGPKPLISS